MTCSHMSDQSGPLEERPGNPQTHEKPCATVLSQEDLGVLVIPQLIADTKIDLISSTQAN